MFLLAGVGLALAGVMVYRLLTPTCDLQDEGQAERAVLDLALPIEHRKARPWLLVFRGQEPPPLPEPEGPSFDLEMMSRVQAAAYCEAGVQSRRWLEARGLRIDASGASASGWFLQVEASEAIAVKICLLIQREFQPVRALGVQTLVLFRGWNFPTLQRS